MFESFRRMTKLIEARPHVDGDDLIDGSISIREGDDPDLGGFITRDPENHSDLRFVSQEYFEENFESASQEMGKGEETG